MPEDKFTVELTETELECLVYAVYHDLRQELGWIGSFPRMGRMLLRKLLRADPNLSHNLSRQIAVLAKEHDVNLGPAYIKDFYHQW